LKKKSKRNLSLVILGIIVAVIIFGYFTVPYILAMPETCTETPYSYKCVCDIGQVKTGMFPWKCEDLPSIPNEVTFPIETWEEARAYAEGLLEGFPCTGEYFYEGGLTGEIFKQCDKYGATMIGFGNIYKGNIVSIECGNIETVDEEGKPVSGYKVFDVEFDPNDGHVYRVSCNENRISCPETTFMDNPKENPQTICGDGCCFFGETFGECPEDCEEEFVPPEGGILCTGEELNEWVVDKTISDVSNLCVNAGGQLKQAGLSEYTDSGYPCDFKSYNCGDYEAGIKFYQLNQEKDCSLHIVSFIGDRCMG